MTTLLPLRDPRTGQLLALGGLLAWGSLFLDFELSGLVMAAALTFALGSQMLCSRAVGLPRTEFRSALISGPSFCLLVRTRDPLIAGGLAATLIAAKFALRVGGRHLFNPTALGVVLALVLARAFGLEVWISPGQWGAGVLGLYLVVVVGLTVAYRSERADVTVAFFGFYAALAFGRSLWFGEPLTIPLHHLQNGALLIFCFHMITDPRTTPDTRAGRVVFAALVAAVAAFITYGLFAPHGPVIALVLAAPIVPLLNNLFSAPRFGGRPYRWPAPTGAQLQLRRAP